MNILFLGKKPRTAVNMNRRVIPRGDAFARRVVGWRNVGVRSVEDRQTLRSLFQIAPMRVGFGHVAAKNDPTLILMNGEREVRGIRTGFSG